MMNIMLKEKKNTARGEKSNPQMKNNKSREIKMKYRMAKRSRR